jgi:hypothetical protein
MMYFKSKWYGKLTPSAKLRIKTVLPIPTYWFCISVLCTKPESTYYYYFLFRNPLCATC